MTARASFAYSRGTTITPQDLDDEEFSLTIDKANYFAFKVDDIEEAHSHINFQQLASDRAAYRLADQFDQDVLGYMSGSGDILISRGPSRLYVKPLSLLSICIDDRPKSANKLVTFPT